MFTPCQTKDPLPFAFCQGNLHIIMLCCLPEFVIEPLLPGPLAQLLAYYAASQPCLFQCKACVQLFLHKSTLALTIPSKHLFVQACASGLHSLRFEDASGALLCKGNFLLDSPGDDVAPEYNLFELYFLAAAVAGELYALRLKLKLTLFLDAG